MNEESKELTLEEQLELKTQRIIEQDKQIEDLKARIQLLESSNTDEKVAVLNELQKKINSMEEKQQVLRTDLDKSKKAMERAKYLVFHM